MRLCILGLANIRLVYTSKQLIMLIQNSLFFVTVLPLLFSGDTLSEETRRGILYLKDIVLASDKRQSPITYIKSSLRRDRSVVSMNRKNDYRKGSFTQEKPLLLLIMNAWLLFWDRLRIVSLSFKVTYMSINC